MGRVAAGGAVMHLRDFLKRGLSTAARVQREGRGLPAIRLLFQDQSLWNVTGVEVLATSAYAVSAVGGTLGTTAKAKKFRVLLAEPDRVLAVTEERTQDRPAWAIRAGAPAYGAVQVVGVSIRRGPRSREERVTLVDACVF